MCFFRMFAVVQFPDEDDALFVIPDCWRVDENTCYWPPYRLDEKVLKAVKASEPVNTKTWKLYKAIFRNKTSL